MFPFRWDYLSKDAREEDLSYSSRTHLSDFDRLFSECNTLKRKPFLISNDSENFNEYTYFHEYVRRALYDTGSNGKDINDNEVLYYDLDGSLEDYYRIDLLDGTSYTLHPESFCLHVYSTGIGIITFNLRNDQHTAPEDILKINEFGRRIYPQFIAGNSLYNTKSTFLADRISGKMGLLEFNEDFSPYLSPLHVHNTFLPPDHILKIFGYRGNERDNQSKSFVFKREYHRKGNVRIRKLTDDRMFFMCYYNNPMLANSLAKIGMGALDNEFAYLHDGFWHAFVFGDKNSRDITVKNEKFQEKLMGKHTYDRWINCEAIDKRNGLDYIKAGTLYGMSRDSFVCLGGWNLLAIHMTTMYYQMAILCLAQRSSVLRFSYEVGLITNQLEKNKDATKDIKDLYKNYIQFINKIYFREVTSQIQGIEMYNQFQEVMGLEKDVKDLDNEIKELHTYISMVEQSNLSKVAVWFLPAGVIVGILGMNTFTEDTFRFNSKMPDWIGIGWILAVVLVSTLCVMILNKYFNRKIK